jgi:hypothetical protein
LKPVLESELVINEGNHIAGNFSLIAGIDMVVLEAIASNLEPVLESELVINEGNHIAGNINPISGIFFVETAAAV